MKSNILTTKFKTILGFLLLGVAFPLAAQDEQPKVPLINLNALAQLEVIGKFQVTGEIVYIYKIDEVTAAAKNIDDFAENVAHYLQRFTAENGFEACALIAKSPGENLWGATLITIGSNTACPKTSAAPKGMRSTGIDIHSHVPTTKFNPNAIDKLFLARKYGRYEMVSTLPELFSPSDFEAGEGYMVSSATLWYQNGIGTTRVIKIMPLLEK